jgi:glycosyltransferase involved in cell wall biosynthesis
MRCGIAFYVSDLIEALPAFEHRKYALHYGTHVTKDAVSHADVSQASNLRRLARVISGSDCDVVSLQHEFGIWGGLNGEHIFEFLAELTKPLVATLHTTFRSHSRPSVQTAILHRLVERSTVSVVLTDQSRKTLCAALEVPQDAVTVIPHGVPPIPYVPAAFTPRPGSEHLRVWKLCSIGFFRPDKGLEETVRALSLAKGLGFDFEYVISASPQPQFREQEGYWRKVRRLIVDLQLGDVIRIDERFLPRAEQIRVIQDSHIGVFAYQDPDHASSGTIPLVMAAGRPVVCTPFEFALAKKREIGEGVTVARDFDFGAIAAAITECTYATSDHVALGKRLHAEAEPWIWRKVGSAYAAAFQSAVGH